MLEISKILELFNKKGLLYLNKLNQIDIIKEIVLKFADGPIFFIPVFLIIGWLVYNNNSVSNVHGKNILLFIFYGIVLSFFINIGIQHLVHFDRPEDYIKTAGKLLLKHIPDASFPSDHAAVSSAFITGLFLFDYKKIAWIFLPFATIMLLSRIVAGVHWPLDIIAGIIVGIVGGYISYGFREDGVLQGINKFIIQVASYIKL